MKRLGTALVLGAALAAFALPPSAIGQEDSAPAPRALSVGQSLTGELSQNDRQRRTGKYEDVYLLEGRQGERVDLRLLSASDLEDPFGRPLDWTANDVSFSVQPSLRPEAPTAELRASGTIVGNFLLDPEYLRKTPRPTSPPLVLLD